MKDLDPKTKDQLDILLDGLYGLDPDDYYQVRPSAPITMTFDQLRKYGMCVGAWASFFLKTPSEACQMWEFQSGISSILGIFPFPRRHLLMEFLTSHGAHPDPFGEEEWEESPYSVFANAAETYYGYRHDTEFKRQRDEERRQEAREIIAENKKRMPMS